MYIWDIDNEKTYNNKMGRYKTKREFDFVNAHAKRFMNILDVGGGSGRFAIPLHKGGHNINVIDKNEEAIEILKNRCPEIDCINDDFLSIDFDNDVKYEMIIAMEVLLYIEEWNAFFRKAYSLLEDKGILIFTATNRNSWRTRLQKLIKPQGNNGDFEYTIMSSKEYFDFIDQTPFKIECVNGFSWIPCSLNSNSPFVNIFSLIERAFLLKHHLGQSPWLLYALKKP